MMNVISAVLLFLVIPILFASSWLGHVIVGCVIAAFIILFNAFVMMTREEYEPPRCEHCGQIIEEGADMALEDEFNDAQ